MPTYREADDTAPTTRPDATPQRYTATATIVLRFDVGAHMSWKAARDAAMQRMLATFGASEIVDCEVEVKT